jgi:iron-sulfur cluster assembly accessory protein
MWRGVAATPDQAYLKAMNVTNTPTATPSATPAELGGGIALTPSAASRVAAIAVRQGKPAILRLSVDGGGCSGFQYKFGLADAPEADDAVTETDGVRLLVDAISLDLVRGCSVDYVESLGGAAFKVDNPNAASGCGCGSSFAV